MEHLVSIKQMLIWVRICPADESTSKSKIIAHVSLTITIFGIVLSHLVASLTFFLTFMKIDLSESLLAFRTMSMDIGMVYNMIMGVLFRNKVKGIFEKLSIIYSANENKDSIEFLADANINSEWWWRAYAKYVFAAVVGGIMNCLLSVFYCLLVYEEFKAEYVYHVFKDILPWNQKTLLGYSMEATYDLLNGWCYLTVSGSYLVLFISLCHHHAAFHAMFKDSIEKLNNGIRCDRKFLCDLIRFQITVKEWFLDSVNVYSPIVMFQLICTVVDLSIDVFYLDLQIHNLNFTIWTIIIGSTVFLLNLFVYCYFGKLATRSFEGMYYSLNDISWYELPTDLQKYFILMSANMQIPLQYDGFAIATLSLNTFINLLRTVSSYYMIFKTVTE